MKSLRIVQIEINLWKITQVHSNNGHRFIIGEETFHKISINTLDL